MFMCVGIYVLCLGLCICFGLGCGPIFDIVRVRYHGWVLGMCLGFDGMLYGYVLG